MAYINLESSIISDSREILDRKLVLTKAEMLSGNYSDSGEKIMLPNSKSVPQYLITFCPDDSSFYFYHSKNTASAETGKFKKLELGAAGVKSGDTAAMESAKSTAEVGDKWLNTDDGKLYGIKESEDGSKSWEELPSQPGDMLYDASNDQMKYYDGSAWKAIGGASAPSASSGSSDDMASALSNAHEGDLFYNTEDDKLYVCKETPAPKHWEEKEATKGDVIYDDNAGSLRYFNGTGWQTIGGADVDEKGITKNPQSKISLKLDGDSLSVSEDGVKVTRDFFFGYDEPDAALGKPGDIYFMAISD